MKPKKSDFYHQKESIYRLEEYFRTVYEIQIAQYSF